MYERLAQWVGSGRLQLTAVTPAVIEGARSILESVRLRTEISMTGALHLATARAAACTHYWTMERRLFDAALAVGLKLGPIVE